MRWNSCALPSQIVGMRIIVDDVRRELEFQTIWCDYGVAKANKSAHINAVSFSYSIFFSLQFLHILRLHCSMRFQSLFSHCSIAISVVCDRMLSASSPSYLYGISTINANEKKKKKKNQK